MSRAYLADLIVRLSRPIFPDEEVKWVAFLNKGWNS
jgi:hypothetical protein